MNYAIILAGGTGTRLGADIPKQYIEVAGKPIIAYALTKIEASPLVDSIIIVAAEAWSDYIIDWIKKENISKFLCIAPAGTSRQHSILNGMVSAKKSGASENDNIIIHDAARPNVSLKTIENCFSELTFNDGVMPALPVKDTMYLCEDGKRISSLVNRDIIFAGQAPEAFKFGKYYALHEEMSENDLAQVRGSSEIAFKNGLNIRIIAGDEHNYKITTSADLEKFTDEIGG